MWRLYTRVCYNLLGVHILRASKGLFTQQHVHGCGGPQVGEVTRLGGVKNLTTLPSRCHFLKIIEWSLSM